MQKFSRFAWIAAATTAAVATWQMAGWDRTGGYVSVGDIAYLQTAHSERAALDGQIVPSGEGSYTWAQFTNGTVAAAIAVPYTNSIVPLPWYRSPGSVLMDRVKAARDRSVAQNYVLGTWIAGGVWPIDGSAIELGGEAEYYEVDAYAIGTITNYPGTNFVWNPYFATNLTSVASNVYPRMQYRMFSPMNTLTLATKNEEKDHRGEYLGDYLGSHHSFTRTEMEGIVGSAWADLDTYFGPYTNSSYLSMAVELEYEYYSVSTSSRGYARGRWMTDWPIGPVGFKLPIPPRFWVPESTTCIVSNAWLVMVAKAEATAWALDTDQTTAGDLSAMEGWLVSYGETIFATAMGAPGMSSRITVFPLEGTNTVLRAYLLPLDRPNPASPLYPLWTFTPPAHPSYPPQPPVFGSYPREYPDASFSLDWVCEPVAILAKGDFETYPERGDTWTDVQYVDQ